jgi:hypothetical protein
MEWCEDASRASIANPLHLKYIPQWTGYAFHLKTLLEHITVPSNIRFYSGLQSPSIPYRLVRLHHQAPAIQGIPLTSTLYWKALQFSDRQWTGEDYRQAYMEAGNEIKWKGRHQDTQQPYVLVHFRCPDHNTHKRDETSFCTRKVLRRLQAAGVKLRGISNNHTLSSIWLQGLDLEHILEPGSYVKDMELILGAAAIVQHASEGWSSYTSVPAMAKGKPLINTYKGNHHRHSFFLQYGDLPPEFFSCGQIKRFTQAAANPTLQQ